MGARGPVQKLEKASRVAIQAGFWRMSRSSTHETNGLGRADHNYKGNWTKRAVTWCCLELAYSVSGGGGGGLVGHEAKDVSLTLLLMALGCFFLFWRRPLTFLRKGMMWADLTGCLCFSSPCFFQLECCYFGQRRRNLWQSQGEADILYLSSEINKTN